MSRRLSVKRSVPHRKKQVLLAACLRFFCLSATIILITLSSNAEGQNLNWKSPVSGNFSDASNWLPNNVPDDTNETPIFNLFGNYAVNFDQPVGSSLKELKATAGSIRFFGSTSDQSLSIDGDILIEGATLELDRKTSPGDLHLATNGQLTIGDGAVLKLLKQSSLSANSTSISTGNSSEATELYLDNDAIANLGNTSISNSGNGNFDGLLSVFNNAIATVGDLNIATTGQADHNGAVQAFSGGTISQPLGVTTIGANSDDGLATLFAGFGGQFLGDEVRVYKNGKITNNGSHVAFNGSLLVDGGIYRETGNAHRSLGANVTVTLLNGAEATFVNSTLELFTGQSIDVDDSNLNSSPAIQIAGGSLNAKGLSPIINAPIEVQTDGTVLVSTGTTARFTQAISNNAGTIMIESGAVAEFEGTYHGIGTTGPGMARFSGEVSPGMSPSIVTFGGEAEWTSDAELLIELGGTTSGSWDQTIVTSNASLDGKLVVELLDVGNGIYSPMIGDQFQIIQAATRQGTFQSVDLPSLSAGGRWVLDYLPNGVTLSVVGEGDYNGDGLVDAADYTVWRDQFGETGQYLAADGNRDGIISELDYGTWVSNYGTSSTTSASYSGIGAQTVPEPYPFTLIAFGMLLGMPKRQTTKV